MTVRVRVRSGEEGATLSVIETTNAAGFGPPLHRRRESELFVILTGRYLFEVEGNRFIARRGDLVNVPAGATRAFVNVTGTGARQQVFVQSELDVAAFFLELRDALADGGEPVTPLRHFGERWGVEFLGPPLACPDNP